MVCFHAQQACEKILKAFLLAAGKSAPRSHDLVLLPRSCALVDPCHTLNAYAARSRYPGESYEPGEEEARKAVETARAIHAAILERIHGTGGRPTGQDAD